VHRTSRWLDFAQLDSTQELLGMNALMQMKSCRDLALLHPAVESTAK